MVCPPRSTPAADTLTPMLSPLASAASAMPSAIPSERFFCVTRPCALASEEQARAAATPVNILIAKFIDVFPVCVRECGEVIETADVVPLTLWSAACPPNWWGREARQRRGGPQGVE